MSPFWFQFLLGFASPFAILLLWVYPCKRVLIPFNVWRRRHLWTWIPLRGDPGIKGCRLQFFGGFWEEDRIQPIHLPGQSRSEKTVHYVRRVLVVRPWLTCGHALVVRWSITSRPPTVS